MSQICYCAFITREYDSDDHSLYHRQRIWFISWTAHKIQELQGLSWGNASLFSARIRIVSLFTEENDNSTRWSDIELSLEIDCEACLESTLQSYPLDLSQDNPGWSDPYIDLEVQIDFINDFTGESFFSWISVIDLKTAKNSVIFDKDARFVTFNYTKTVRGAV